VSAGRRQPVTGPFTLSWVFLATIAFACSRPAWRSRSFPEQECPTSIERGLASARAGSWRETSPRLRDLEEDRRSLSAGGSVNVKVAHARRLADVDTAFVPFMIS